MELTLAQLQNPSDSPWGAPSAWVSATEVSVMSTANTAGQRPPTAVARRRLIYNAASSRWVVKPGTYRQR